MAGVDRVALRDITFQVQPRTLVGLSGANGSGKTTLLRILAGILFPTSGKVESSDRLTYIGAAERQFQERITGYENLRFYARLESIALSEIIPACEAMGLSSANAHEPVWMYSSGMKHRLALARSLMGKSELILLDEPTRSLDKEGRHEVGERLKDLRERSTIIVASHDMDILALCDRVIGLEAGRIIS